MRVFKGLRPLFNFYLRYKAKENIVEAPINFREACIMAVIYRITNMANGKYYIGSADSFARREWQHKYDLKRGVHKNPRLQAAWNKYGEEMFVFEVLEEIPEGGNQLQVEDGYLKKCVGQPDCYNINPSAELSRLGIVLTQEVKENISAGRKGKHAGEDHYRYGKTVSEEVRQKIGMAQKGKPKSAGRKVSEEGRAKIRANIEAGRSHMHWLGRKHTEEAKAKLRKPILVMPDNRVFPSLTDVLQHYGLKMPTLRRALLSGRELQKGPLKGYVFRYQVQESSLLDTTMSPEYNPSIPGFSGVSDSPG
jgi:group I intron endonuclease